MVTESEYDKLARSVASNQSASVDSDIDQGVKPRRGKLETDRAFIEKVESVMPDDGVYGKGREPITKLTPQKFASAEEHEEKVL